MLPVILMRDFDIPDIFRKYNTVERKLSRRFLKCAEENYVVQTVVEAVRERPHWICCL